MVTSWLMPRRPLTCRHLTNNNYLDVTLKERIPSFLILTISGLSFPHVLNLFTHREIVHLPILLLQQLLYLIDCASKAMEKIHLKFLLKLPFFVINLLIPNARVAISQELLTMLNFMDLWTPLALIMILPLRIQLRLVLKNLEIVKESM